MRSSLLTFRMVGLLAAASCSLATAADELVMKGTGTGFFITADGYFVTNHHVIDGAEAVAVKFDDKQLAARIIKTDATNDIAILKIDGEFPCLPLGADLEATAGDDVFTVGYPMTFFMGVAPKTTMGTISALTGVRDDARMFQISVQIQSGNSGGALVQKSTGNVIGITSSSLSNRAVLARGGDIPQNVNYAMKSSYIRPLLATIPGLVPKLIKTHEAARPWREVQQDVEKCSCLVMAFGRPEQEPEAQPAPGPPPAEPPVAARIWVFPDSSTKIIDPATLRTLDADMLWRARNEIYARNGLIFSTPRGKSLVAALGDAYRPRSADQSVIFNQMNQVEQANVESIKKLEK